MTWTPEVILLSVSENSELGSPRDPSGPSNRRARPSRWVVRWLRAAASAGARTALELACGDGRHVRAMLDGVPSLQQIVAVDRDLTRIPAGLAADPRLVLHAIDLETGAGWPAALRGRLFDVLVVTNYLWRPLLDELFGSLAPAGVLIYETFAVGNEVYGRPRRPEFLLRDGELLERARVAGCRVIAYEHGRVERIAGPVVVQRIAAVGGQWDRDRHSIGDWFADSVVD